MNARIPSRPTPEAAARSRFGALLLVLCLGTPCMLIGVPGSTS
jgi:hypothetical protein